MQEYADYVAAKLGDRIKIDQHVRFQALGDCQVIAHSVAHDLPQFKRVFGEIEVEPYRDWDGEEQCRAAHHWVTLDGKIYDFAKGTLRGRLEVEVDIYDPEVIDSSIYHAMGEKP